MMPDLEALLRELRDVVFRTDVQGRFTYLSPAWAAVAGAGVDEALGRPFPELLHEGDREAARELFATLARGGDDRWLRPVRLLLRDAPPRLVEVHAAACPGNDGAPAGTLGTLRDVTGRRTGARKMGEGRELDAVRTLAVGVAHEISNPLAYVTSNLHFARDALAEGTEDVAEVQRALADASDGAERVRCIVRDLKLLARGEDAPRIPVSLPHVIEAAAGLARSELEPRARLVRELSDTPHAFADEGKLAQVLVNLLVNAAQAMPPRPVEENVVRVRTWREDARVGIEVSDNGVGIGPDILPRVFDPFFTTRRPGQGTGLGLAISRTHVEALGGEITAASRPGEGTAFRVLLPAVAEAGEPPASAPRRRVLLVDDEPLVLSALRRMLARAHDVETATSGRDALERIRGGAHFDVVLCDLMMPDLGGPDLHRALCEVDAPLASRMIFMTGGAFTAEARAFLDGVPNPRLGKPFAAGEVASALEFVLGRADQTRTGSAYMPSSTPR